MCGARVHEECIIPLTATKFEDVWVLWFCDDCKWVSDWPGMPAKLKKPGWERPIWNPALAERRKR